MKPNPPSNNQRELTPNQWMHITGILVLDPDGWRSNTTNFSARDWEEPITEAEFRERAIHSTCTFPDGYFDDSTDDCQHTKLTVEADVRKIVEIDAQSKPLNLQIVLQAKCATCGIEFHFPGFMPGIGEKHAAALNPHATMLSLPIKPGPALPITLEGPPVIPTMESTPAHN